MNLYPEDRAKQPMPEILRRMRERDLLIRETPQGIAVSFRYPDRYKAQAAVRRLVTTLFEVTSSHAPTPNLEVVAPANLPEVPRSPNRLMILLAGLTTGLTGGIVLTRRRRSQATAAAA